MVRTVAERNRLGVSTRYGRDNLDGGPALNEGDSESSVRRAVLSSRLGLAVRLFLLEELEPSAVVFLFFRVGLELDRLHLPLDGGGEVARLGVGGGERLEAVGLFLPG